MTDLEINNTIEDNKTYAIKEYSEAGTKKKPLIVANGDVLKKKFVTDKFSDIINKYDRLEGGVVYEVIVLNEGDINPRAVYRQVAPTLRIDENNQYVDKNINNNNGLGDMVGNFYETQNESHREEIRGLKDELSEERKKNEELQSQMRNMIAEQERLRMQVEIEKRMKELEEKQDKKYSQEIAKLEDKTGLADGVSDLLSMAMPQIINMVVPSLMQKFMKIDPATMPQQPLDTMQAPSEQIPQQPMNMNIPNRNGMTRNANGTGYSQNPYGN